jgi:hypothetical protein
VRVVAVRSVSDRNAGKRRVPDGRRERTARADRVKIASLRKAFAIVASPALAACSRAMIDPTAAATAASAMPSRSRRFQFG